MNKPVEFLIKEGMRKGKRIFRMFDRIKKSENDEQVYFELKPNGYDHIVLNFRKKYKTNSGSKGDKKIPLYGWTFNSVEAVQLATLLIKLAQDNMRDSNENPYYHIVANKEKISYGQNFINEDIATAEERIKKRKSRSYMLGLMQRFVETCEDKELVEFMAHNLLLWAESKGGFELQQAEKMVSQLGLIDKHKAH